MMRYFSILFLAAVLIVISCEKESEDAPILTGTVKGHIQIADCYGYNLDDRSGVKISISANAYSADTLTDHDGNFLFEDVPFGKYNLTCTKENYVQQTGHCAFGHTGGEVSTTVSETLLGIPDFSYLVDSVERNYCYLNSYVVLNEASKTWAGATYLVLMFFADTPDVDAENYDAYHIDVGYLPAGNAWNMSFSMCYTDVLSSFTSDSIYCRVYPIPFYYDYSNEEILSLPRGKPSNVFAFEN
jgi:hypothetical protein